jgi:peptidoglycan hydrolase-like protein with peptidoglycan-binding domain
MPNSKDVAWFKSQFGQSIASALAGTPLTLDLVTAIACQETGYIWQTLRKKLDDVKRVLELCVGDTIDGSGGRSAFPKNKAALLAKPRGAVMFAIARKALEEMAEYIPGYKTSVQNPSKFVRGYGIFQYDLQFFLEDPDFFLNKEWAHFDRCLDKLLMELKTGLEEMGYESKPSLTAREMAFVAIVYNKGSCDPSKGLKQGHLSDGKYYGENIADFIQLSKSVPWPGPETAQPIPAFDSAAAAVAAMGGGPASVGKAALAIPATLPEAFLAAAMGPAVLSPSEAPVNLRALRTGSQGDLVRAWQSFLVGQGFDPGGLDGDFGDKTAIATKSFQAKHGIAADGVAGRETLIKAMSLGFELIEEPAADTTGSNFPPRPNFAPLVGTAGRQAVFGTFDFVAAPQPGNREAIRILGTWTQDNITSVPVPQLRRALGAGASAGMHFHRLAAEQLKGLWQEWEDANLLDRVLSFDGAFVPRFIRGSSRTLSNHAFGSAFDINAAENPLGSRPKLVGERGCVRELVPIAHKWGFYWGGHFGSRPDGMHFEIAFIKTA